MWKITIFSQPRGGHQRHFFAQFFFSPNIDFDHRSVHLGWFIWVFWEFMVKKMINFPAQWHIKEFYNSNFFEFWIFWFKSLLWLFGSVFHVSQGSLAKCEEMRMIFFLEVSCVKNYHFFTAPRWSEKALFCTIFFLRISILITGRCIWGG